MIAIANIGKILGLPTNSVMRGTDRTRCPIVIREAIGRKTSVRSLKMAQL
jgi:hypothetical protein